MSKNILITGASRGIGYLTAKTLAKADHHVIASMRDIKGHNAVIATELAGWATEHGHSLEVVELDVTSEDSVDSAIQALEERLNIDVLINNAGIMPCGITEAYTPEQVSACLDVNVVGVARTCRATLPYMRKRKSGLMIHISSSSGRLAMPFFGLYCASKWALEAMAESMHYELASFGVESIIVEPGGHGTDLIQDPPVPSDTRCIDSYGYIAKGPANIVEMFQGVFAQGDKSTDAQNVADQLAELVDMKGERPIRTTVGHNMGVDQINARVAPVQAEFIRSFLPMAGLEAQDKRLFVSARITLKPEYYAEGLAALESIIPQTLNEPGCHVFSLMKNKDSNGTLHLFECFEDEQALQIHYEQDYTKAVFAQYEEWLEKPVEVTKMFASSSVTSAQF
tara:strand:- start:217 stop:1404 length:1188 start_codon:yes stop_codon:yes gene_type:complete